MIENIIDERLSTSIAIRRKIRCYVSLSFYFAMGAFELREFLRDISASAGFAL